LGNGVVGSGHVADGELCGFLLQRVVEVYVLRKFVINSSLKYSMPFPMD
jgi:hypothetical protein